MRSSATSQAAGQPTIRIRTCKGVLWDRPGSATWKPRVSHYWG